MLGNNLAYTGNRDNFFRLKIGELEIRFGDIDGVPRIDVLNHILLADPPISA